ncbi:MAG: hypothetical protein LBC82_01700 [Oscillospiraceae bacterium]|jgi:hypothetical protein|nr:hypothetical protein [Oscillospiraceae bacterium]
MSKNRKISKKGITLCAEFVIYSGLVVFGTAWAVSSGADAETVAAAVVAAAVAAAANTNMSRMMFSEI